MSTLKSNSIQPTTTGNNLIFRTGAGDVERMRIDTSGNVGIGTNSPDSKLHVVGSQIKFDTSTTAGLRLYEDADTASFLRFRPLNASQRGFVFSNDGDAPHLTVSWDAANSATTRVGIGTASPAVELDVVGQARTSVGTTAGSNAKTLTTKDYVDNSGNTAFVTMAYNGHGTPVSKAVTLKAGKWLAVAQGHCLFSSDGNGTVSIVQTISCAAVSYSTNLLYEKNRGGDAGHGRYTNASSTTAVEFTVSSAGSYTFTIGAYNTIVFGSVSRGTTLVLHYLGTS
jgi:hypothetical protein